MMARARGRDFRPHVGIKLPNWGDTSSVDMLTAVAATADATGFDSLWVSDHIALPVGADGPLAADTPFYEVLTTLAFAGALTRRAQLATGVLIGPLRNPLLLAKQAATIDRLTGGRLVLGMGSGWLEPEFEALHKNWRGRGRAMATSIATMRHAWRDGTVHPPGTREDLQVGLQPQPIAGAIPVLLGGRSDVALDRAAAIADGWYGANLSVDELADTATTLAAKRPPGSGPLCIGVKPPAGKPQQIISAVADFAAVGADFVVLEVDFDGPDPAAACAAVTLIAEQLQLSDRPARPLTCRIIG